MPPISTLLIGTLGAQRSSLGGFGFGLTASMTNDTSHKPTPTPPKITKTHRTESIDLTSQASTATSPLISAWQAKM
jgi:hypothetical protein